MDSTKCEILTSQRAWYQVEKKLLPSKLAYFLLQACMGCYLPYINIFLTSISLTAREAGFISGICFVSAAVSGPAWGLLIDNLRAKRLIYFLMCVGAAGAVFPLPWIAREVRSHELTKCFLNGTIVNTTLSITTTTTMTDSNISSVPLKTKYCYPDLVPFKSTLFYLMLGLTNVANIFIIPLAAMVDSFVMNIIKTNKIDSSFGMQRVFGSIGFGFTSFVSGLVVDHYDHPILSKYTGIFYVFLGFMIFVIPVGFVLIGQSKWDTTDVTDCKPNTGDKEKEESKATLINPSLGDVKDGGRVIDVLKKIDNTMFFFMVLIGGIMGNILMGFLFLLMEVEMNATKTAMGVTILVSCIAEVFTFPFTHRIIKACGGPIQALEVGLLMYIVRFVALSYLKNAWFTIPLHLLHSVTFALFWAASIEQTEIISNENIYGTMFGLLNSVYFGCGGLTGNMGGGVIFDKFSGLLLYRYSAILTGILLFVFVMYFHVAKMCKSKSKSSTYALN